MLRAVAARTEVGLRAKALMESGQLVGDDIVVSIIKDRIAESDCVKGFILDGFPRTLEQSALTATAENGEAVSLVLALVVPDEVLEARIAGDGQHKSSGRTTMLQTTSRRALSMQATVQFHVWRTCST